MPGRKSKRGREGWTGYHERREPFTPGNEVAVTHGAYSEALVAPEAERVRQELQASGPDYLREPMFGPALRLVAAGVARSERVTAYVDSMALEDQLEPPKPGTSAPAEMARKFEAQAINGLSKMGLTPDSAAKMTRQVAGTQVDIARLMADIQEDDEAEQAG